MTKFAERIKEFRIERNMQQKDLAAVLFVNQRTISNWERKINVPDYDMLIKIAKYFEVSIDYLLGNDDYSNKNN